LLGAAEAVITEMGEAATMSAIADRAWCGYRLALSVFSQQGLDHSGVTDRVCPAIQQFVHAAGCAGENPQSGNSGQPPGGFGSPLTGTHPALPALLDAPQSTRAPLAMRHLQRQRFAGLLIAQSPRLPKHKALWLGTATLNIIKAMNQLYLEFELPELPRREWRQMIEEFGVVLLCYFDARLKRQGYFNAPLKAGGLFNARLKPRANGRIPQ
jgi:hypothetical protein